MKVFKRYFILHAMSIMYTFNEVFYAHAIINLGNR